LGVLDCTKTPMGKRRLREMLTLPLRDRAAIAARQAAVTELVQQSLLRERLRDRLGPIRDLARITGRASAGIMTPRDGLALLDTLLTLPGLRADAARTTTPLLQGSVRDLGEHENLAALLQQALDMEAPAAFIPGRVIRSGYAGELDELRGLAAGSKETLAKLEAQERGASGLKVKVGHNRVHGYYFEIPKSQKDKAPAHWFPRQSLVNAERYITQELRDLEEKVLGAEERATQLELALFKALVDAVARESDSLRRTAEAIGWLDVFTTLAQVAAEKRWVCPETLAEPQIDMIESRHPVLEELLGVQQFIPNDARFDPETSQINILTGPNMAGKSTFMRQVALCCVLHQIGSFVPAKAARLGCFDRILTRVGATDDLARGQSTFMVEMVEAAQILHQATPRSLILLDEIGRGTSTYDGLAIAWALAEYLHNTPGCRALTLFATHYHELTQLAEHYPAVKNWRVTLKEQDGQIVFLRRVTEGRAQKSYGVAVARLAGLPPAVVDRAGQILAQLDHQQINPKIDAARPGDRSKKASWPADETLPLFG
ncbi:MAG: DNA mismatch repair protein MutS, partial [bacterium]